MKENNTPKVESDKQAFEFYPRLADHIRRMALTGQTGSGSEWSNFLFALNMVSALALSVGEQQPNTSQWIDVKERTPHCWEAGDWDGRKSDEVLAQDESGENFIAVVYEGILDGSKFLDWYSSRDHEIVGIVRWMKIPL